MLFIVLCFSGLLFFKWCRKLADDGIFSFVAGSLEFSALVIMYDDPFARSVGILLICSNDYGM